jgi:hypothetical protein
MGIRVGSINKVPSEIADRHGRQFCAGGNFKTNRRNVADNEIDLIVIDEDDFFSD